MTGPLVAAIEHTWAAIQSRHPDVPDVVLTLGNGSTRPGQLTLGHFHAGKWATRDQSTEATEAAARLPELFVGGEGLAAGPRELLGTLLHEAAHGVAAAREIHDTSRQGRYHNTRYRDLAGELGLGVERDPRIGWSLTTVPDSAAALYSEQIDQLGTALTAHRVADTHGTGRGPSSNNGLVATCACDPPRKIRLSRTAYDTGPVICGVCEAAFTAPDTTETSAPREGPARMTSSDHSQPAERPLVIEYLTEPLAVADQVDPGAQLRWLTYLHRIGATREQLDAATEPLLARLDRATAAVTARETEHHHAARLAIESYRRDLADGLPPEQARRDAVTTAATLAAALHHPDDPRKTREAELLAAPVTNDHIDTAPTPALRDTLTRTAAAQQAITTLRDSHASTADDTIGLYHEGQDNYSDDPDHAQHAALREAWEGVRAVNENAYYELDYQAQQRHAAHDRPDAADAAGASDTDERGERVPSETVRDQSALDAEASTPDDLDRLRQAEARHDRAHHEPPPAALTDQSVPARAQRPDRDQDSDVVDSQAVHVAPRGRDDQREARDMAHRPDEDDGAPERADPVRQARAAVNVLAAHKAQQRRRDEAEQARSEQLNRWHEDDHGHSSSTAAVKTGGRAVYGWGLDR